MIATTVSPADDASAGSRRECGKKF